MFQNEIEQAEEVWGDYIISYCLELYAKHWLPSHNLEHHQRVWKNACLLAPYLESDIIAHTKVFYEQLMLACYFHDLGLLVEKGPKHGIESRIICENFLAFHQEKIRFNTGELLLAIEHHDDKEYQWYSKSDNSALYRILTLADDFDAFGAIGCYRYIEIYLMRDYTSDRIPGMIIRNANNRYRNFLSKTSTTDFPVAVIQNNYELLIRLIKEDSFESRPQSLINWISNEFVTAQIDPFDFIRGIKANEISNDRVNYFIQSIKSELG